MVRFEVKREWNYEVELMPVLVEQLDDNLFSDTLCLVKEKSCASLISNSFSPRIYVRKYTLRNLQFLISRAEYLLYLVFCSTL